MGKLGFREKLAQRQREVNSLVCLEINPLLERLPEEFKQQSFHPLWFRIETWINEIIKITAPYVCMFRFKKRCYDVLGNRGFLLESIMNFTHFNYPDIPIFLDYQEELPILTQEKASEHYLKLEIADGISFNPYKGKMTNDKYYSKKALVGTCLTSRPSALEIQNAELKDGRLYWELIAEKILLWAEEMKVVENAGLEIAALYKENCEELAVFSWPLARCRRVFPEENVHQPCSWPLARCREIVGNKLWFLINQKISQEAYLEETIRKAYAGSGSIALSFPVGNILSDQGEDWAEIAVRVTQELRDRIREAGGKVS